MRKHFADLSLTGHVLTDFLLTSTDKLTAAGKLRYDATAKKYYGYTTAETALLTKLDEGSLNVNSATKLASARSLWGNSFDGTADVSGDITLGSGKKIYFGDTGRFIAVDSDGNLYTDSGFYSTSFISARGKDDSGSSGGGATLQEVWDNLKANAAPGLNETINPAHIPTLEQSKVKNLTSDLSAINTDIANIQALIPAGASSGNQLADKSYVDDAVSSGSATFRGTFESTGDLPTDNVNKNDYAFVIVADSSGDPEYWRYKYDGGKWAFEYILNNSAFTVTQWSAINSGITETLVDGMVTSVAASGNGNAVTSLSISGHVLTCTKGTTFLTTAGKGISVSGATVSAKVDSTGEFLSVSDSGLKVSGVSDAISNAVSGAVFMSSSSATSGTSLTVTVSGRIRGVSTQYGGAECICEVSYGTYNSGTGKQTATISWGFTATSSAPMTINVFYTK